MNKKNGLFSDPRLTSKTTEWPKNNLIKLEMLEMTDFGDVLSN